MSVVAITGASAGVGRAASLAFARAGYDVALMAREPTRLAEAAAEIESLGRRAFAVPVDVADADAVDRAATQIEEGLGPIDVWVNNAMASVYGPLESTPASEIRRVTEVTYLGVVHGTQSALRRMRARDRGTIVQISSGLAYRSIPLQSAYCGAKAAARGFTDSVRCELIHDGSAVRLTMVHLPALNTPQFSWARSHLRRTAQPVPPVFQPEVAADAIVRAVEHPKREVFVGGSTMAGALLQKIAPGLLDHYLASSAWQGQQTDEPEEPGRPDNLERPVKARVGAHGAFEDMAHDRSVTTWLTTHPKLLAIIGGVTAIAIGLLRPRMRSG